MTTSVGNVQRAVTVALALTAWLALSNHCAFTAIATQSETVQSECPFHSKPAKQKPAPAGIECCKVLRALTPSAKPSVRTNIDLPHVDIEFVAHPIIGPRQIPLAPETLDTGPPGESLLAQLIWSMPAHAPPRRA